PAAHSEVRQSQGDSRRGWVRRSGADHCDQPGHPDRGRQPMPEGGAAEAALTADYNAEMIEQIARYPRVRDLALFVGNPDDIVPHQFGDGLPLIRQWVQDHYQFPGYITGFDPVAVADRDALRAELGYANDDRVCLVTVGGS